MVFKKNVMFLDAASFNSKDGRKFNKVDIVDLNLVSHKARAVVAFVNELPAATAHLAPGDVVTGIFEIADLTGKPQLIGIEDKVVVPKVLPVEMGKEVK